MSRSHSPYECFKSDRHRLLALMSRDIRIVLVTAILGGAGIAGAFPDLSSLVTRWMT